MTATTPSGQLVPQDRAAVEGALPRMSFLALALVMAMAVIVAYSESTIVPALRSIGTQFGASPDDVAWVSSIYLLVGAASVPLVGKLGDIYGRKRVLVISMGLFGLGTLLNGYAWSLESVIVFRAIQGVGLAFFPLAFALINEQQPAARVPLATGLVTGMASIGATLGLVVGAWVTGQFGWQLNFQIVGPLALLVTACVAFVALESRERERVALDVFGAVYFAVGVGLVLAGVLEAPDHGWTSVTTATLFLVGGAIVVLFVWHELRTKAPMLEFRVPRIGSILRVNVINFIAGACFYLVFLGVVHFVQGAPPGFSLDVRSAALVLLPGAILMIVFAMISGALIRRMGVRVPIFAGLMLLVLGFSSLLLLHQTALQVTLAFIPAVGGVAMLYNSTVNGILALSPPAKLGAQNATLTVFEQVGSAIGASIVGSVLASLVHPVTGFPSEEAYVLVFSLGIALAVIGLLLLWSLPLAESRLGAVAPRSDDRLGHEPDAFTTE